MNPSTQDLEEQLAGTTDPIRRSRLAAELAWNLRVLDPARAQALTAELMQQAGQSADTTAAAIARILQLTLTLAQGSGNDVIAQRAFLENEIPDEALWLARLASITGSALQATGDYAESLLFHRRSLAIREELSEEAGIAASLDNIGTVHRALGEYRKALEYHRRGLAIHESIAYGIGIATSLTNIGVIHHALGDYAEALEFSRRALAIREQLGEITGTATSLANIGYLHFTLGEYSEALEYHLRALGLREQVGNTIGIADSLNHIGLVHDLRGEFGAALEFYSRSLALHEEAANRHGIAIAFENIGTIHFQLGEYPAALDCYLRSLAVREEIGDRAGIAGSLGNIGNVHAALGDRGASLEYCRRSLAVREELGDRNGIALILGNMGNDYNALGDYSEALDHQQRSLAIRQETGDREGIALALGNIGGIHQNLGEYTEALEHFRQARDIYEQAGIPAGVAASTAGIGHALAALGDHDEAIVMLRSAVGEATRIEAKEIIVKAYERLVVACEQIGDFAGALESLREHQRVNDQIQRDEARQQLRQLEARKQIEIEQLRNVELKGALDQLQQAHLELKQTQAQLVHAEKMSSLGQVTAGIAHEINNPINYISSSMPSLARDIGFLEEVIETVPDEEQRSEAAEVIEEMRLLVDISRDGARRVTEIVKSLRSFSRLDEDETKFVSLHDGLDATLALLGAKLDGRVTIRREYGEIPPVECRPGQINQVFMNIIGNAVDAIDGTGEVIIGTTTDGSSVHVSIADNGCGIDTENLERVFEPFYTTKDVGKGQGLGLAVSYGIMKSHGGTIDVQSRPGQGSTFTMTLPLSRNLTGG